MAESKKLQCKYGADCYQKNKIHLAKYTHPTKKMLPDEEISPSRNWSPVESITNEPKRPRRSRSPSTGKKDYNLRSPRSSGSNGSDHLENTRTNTPKIIHQPDVDSSQSKKNSSGPSPEKDIDFINDVYDKETRFSQRAEYKEMLKEPNRFIKHKFLVEMPSDFFLFWDFCKASVKKEQKPESIFAKFGLTLLGPFDVLSGKFDDAQMYEPGDYLRHCRYYYDPPEFQTILKKDKSGVHYGYWRDVPNGTISFVARNDVDKGCEINIIADNIFSAVIYFLDKDASLTPFNRATAASTKRSLEEWAKRNSVRLDSFSSKIRARNLKVVTKTFHKAGLVVPVDKKTDVGYRELLETDANIKKILSLLNGADGDETTVSLVMEKLQPLITAANIAVDECDFGNSIELGINLFCSGAPEMHAVLLQLLVNGYTMVEKPQFLAIMKAHLEQRLRGTNLSIL